MKYQKVSKQSILEATAKVIAQKGLDKTSVDDIIKEADVAKGSIYFHFKNKDDLLISAIRFSAETRINQIKEALKNISSPKEKLIRLFKANSLMLKQDRDSFLMTYALLLSSHNDLRTHVATEYISNYITFVAEIINDGIVQGEFKSVDAKSIATSFVIANDITGILHFANGEIIEPEKMINNLFKLILK